MRVSKTRHHWQLLAIAFSTGFVIIAMELSAARLAAPYFGTTVFVWSNVIAVVLLCLSLGYYLGGLFSEKHPNLRYLLRIIFVAGLISFLIPWLSSSLGNTLTSYSSETGSIVYTLLGSFLFTFFLFGLPLVLLALVSPFLIKLYSVHENHMGSAAGKLSAWSTLGSLLGTFIPTLFLIPTLGTRMTLQILAILLTVIGSFGLKRKHQILAVLLALLTLLFSNYPTIGLANSLTDHVVYARDSLYSYVRVVADSSGTNYLVFNQGRGAQSLYNPNQILTGHYYDYLAAVAAYAPGKPRNVLIIGLAGGTVARMLNAVYGNTVAIDAAEIDPDVINLAKNDFGLSTVPVHFINQDGRMYLHETSKKYDYIIVDAYQNESVIPWTLTTQEFWQQVASHLYPGGLIAMNVFSEGSDMKLVDAIANSQASVFPHTYVVQKEEADQNEKNFVIISSLAPITFNALPLALKNSILAPTATELSEGIQPFAFNPSQEILTDDKAPVEFLSYAK